MTCRVRSAFHAMRSRVAARLRVPCPGPDYVVQYHLVLRSPLHPEELREAVVADVDSALEASRVPHRAGRQAVPRRCARPTRSNDLGCMWLSGCPWRGGPGRVLRCLARSIADSRAPVSSKYHWAS